MAKQESDTIILPVENLPLYKAKILEIIEAFKRELGDGRIQKIKGGIYVPLCDGNKVPLCRLPLIDETARKHLLQHIVNHRPIDPYHETYPIWLASVLTPLKGEVVWSIPMSSSNNL